jgi:hypothetical protein
MPEEITNVLWPSGSRAAANATVARSSGGLAGSRVGFAWDQLFHGDRMWELIKEELGSRFPDVTFVGPDEFGNFHDKFTDDVGNERLKELMLKHEIRSAIVGVGA